MKNVPTAIRFIINIIFFVIYSIVGIIFGNFLFGLILTLMDKTVPGSNDQVHLKIAGAVVVIILISSMILRKYFYISLGNGKNDDIEIKDLDETGEDKKMKIYVNKEIK